MTKGIRHLDKKLYLFIQEKFMQVRAFERYIPFNEVDMRIYLPEKVIFTKASRPSWISLLRVVKSSCIPKLKSINVLLYDF